MSGPLPAIRSYLETDEDQVVALWNAEVPAQRRWNDPRESVARKLKVGRDLFLVALLHQKVVGTLMGGYDGHRGWVYSLAVGAGNRRQGIASKLMKEAERRLRELGCPKVNLQIMPGNDGAIALYQTLGFKIEERVSMGKPLM